ncbi:MAG TPA: hypothetical protein VE593_02630 [Nitrososphaeraceae archaeon]|nr:hypothetical protein [Nitrososphaeraceae archaeon]
MNSDKDRNKWQLLSTWDNVVIQNSDLRIIILDLRDVIQIKIDLFLLPSPLSS